MKFKDYFSKLKTQGKITNEEYDKFLETVPDGELPDALYEVLQDKFLTIDRALTHKEVYGKLKRENLDPIDNDLKKILTFIDGVDRHTAARIDGLNGTYEKIGAITAELPKLVDKVKANPGDSEETKKQIEEYKKTVSDLTNKITEINTGYTEKEKKLQSEFAQKENAMKIDWELHKKAGSFTLAESHEKLRDSITKIILSELKSDNVLALGEKPGEIIVQEIVNGTPRPKFNGNDPVTIDKLLEERFEPYIKKSASDDDGGKTRPQAKSVPVKTDTKVFRQGRSTTVQ